uniref:Uncharacterized protein n=1 Tax=Rangifer tarandus platyrhynchus TaxID=3082113 RepID=A0ACB0EEA3_RANTA|nr:unnamed protein product [Rangifer tarandus platyrhynchus]
MRLGPRGRQRTSSSASREGEDPASMPAEGGGTQCVSGGPSRGQWSLKPPDSAPAVALTKDHQLGDFKHSAYSPSLPDPEVQGQGVQVKVCRGSGKPGWLFLTSALPPSGLKPAQALLGPKGPALPSALSVSLGLPGILGPMPRSQTSAVSSVTCL